MNPPLTLPTEPEHTLVLDSPAVWPPKPQYASAVRRPGEVFGDSRLSCREILSGATGVPLTPPARTPPSTGTDSERPAAWPTKPQYASTVRKTRRGLPRPPARAREALYGTTGMPLVRPRPPSAAMNSPTSWPTKPQYASAMRMPGETFRGPRPAACAAPSGTTQMPLPPTARDHRNRR